MVPKKPQPITRPAAPVTAKVTQLKQQSSPKQMPLHPTMSESVKLQPVMVHHDIEWNGRNYAVDIPEKADDVLMKETALPDDVLWSTITDVQHTALLLFANYVDAATEIAESCGGGGNAPESGWGRKEDEDDIAWAHRCAQKAFGMHIRRSRGIHW
jgi:hypothetical protein